MIGYPQLSILKEVLALGVRLFFVYGFVMAAFFVYYFATNRRRKF